MNSQLVQQINEQQQQMMDAGPRRTTKTTTSTASVTSSQRPPSSPNQQQINSNQNRRKNRGRGRKNNKNQQQPQGFWQTNNYTNNHMLNPAMIPPAPPPPSPPKPKTIPPLNPSTIEAERFTPQQKILQWNHPPHLLLIVSPRIIQSSQNSFQNALNRWMHDPEHKRSSLELSMANIVQYISDFKESSRIAIFNQNSSQSITMDVYQLFHVDINVMMQVIISYREKVERLKVKFDEVIKDRQQLPLSSYVKPPIETKNPVLEYGSPFDESRIIRTDAERVARICESLHKLLPSDSCCPSSPLNPTPPLTHMESLLRLNEDYKATIRDYVTRMMMLIDVEQLQSFDDMNCYDLYSLKFDYVEIVPPGVTHEFCPVCMGTWDDGPSFVKLCGYHLTLLRYHASQETTNGNTISIPALSTFHHLSRLQSHPKPSTISTPLQHSSLTSIFSRLRPAGDKIVAHLIIPGVAENRPLLSIGDAVRLRFGNVECLGEISDVVIKTERVSIFLPPPPPRAPPGPDGMIYDDPYTAALRYTKLTSQLSTNKNGDTEPGVDPHPHRGLFDLRFGLFSGRILSLFRSCLQNALARPSWQITRLLAPTPLLTSPSPHSTRRGINECLWVTKNLNKEQKRCVLDVVRRSHGSCPYIVYGPPGTGKTTVVVESIVQVLRSDGGSKILVCAPSDAACDVIARRLGPVLPMRDDDDSKKYEMMRVNWTCRNPASLPPELLGVSVVNDRGFFVFPEVERLKEVNVVICRCFVAGVLETASSEKWMRSHFTHVFVDECCQSFECETLTPLLSVGPECSIVLAGDPKQLGPTVRSLTAERSGMALSLQERLMALPLYRQSISDGFNNERYCVMTKLVDNYRSHKALLKIPSRLFYNGLLNCRASPRLTNLCTNFEYLRQKSSPLMVYDVPDGREMSKLDTPSYYNLVECQTICKIIRSLLSSPAIKIHAGQICVITCFRAQVLQLRTLLRKESDMGSVSVGVVEDFQGQEKEVVLISTVLTKHHERWKRQRREREKGVLLGRSLGDGSEEALGEVETPTTTSGLGFMADPKRFNVAITRASALCIIVGHVEFLETSGTYWEALIKHVRFTNGITNDATTPITTTNCNGGSSSNDSGDDSDDVVFEGDRDDNKAHGGDDEQNELDDDDDDDDDDEGIMLLMRRVQELNLGLEQSRQDNRYEWTMRGYYQDEPEWRDCF